MPSGRAVLPLCPRWRVAFVGLPFEVTEGVDKRGAANLWTAQVPTCHSPPLLVAEAHLLLSRAVGGRQACAT